MNIGSKVICVSDGDSRKLSYGSTYTIDETRHDISGELELHFQELSGRNWYRADRFQMVNLNNNNQLGGDTMNPTIRTVFAADSLELAEKVNQHFGNEIANTFTGELILRANKDAYVKEIARREDEQAQAAHKALGGDVATAIAAMAGKVSNS